ncbi:MAG: hypothetical protein ABL982_01200 [Vicinamibacterales bacterium]
MSHDEDESNVVQGEADEAATDRPRVLVLYDSTQTFTNTVAEHLLCLGRLPGYAVHFCHARPDSTLPVPLAAFDCVIIHYSVRIAFELLSAADAWHVSGFKGLKCLFIQDEYDHTETARSWITRLGIHVVFTCVAPDRRDWIYPTSRFPDVTFVSNLTGYVPALLDDLPPPRPLTERTTVIGYRGRELPYWYGRLAREKWTIGKRMRELCDARGIRTDIAWDEHARIYGDAWYEFLGSCRSTLGTESGSNVFDDEGLIRRAIQDDLRRTPSLSFEEVYTAHLDGVEQPGLMNQVSPKIFEAIALRTVLVLFEGEYSGVVTAGRHYISLRKDFSNVDDVLAQLGDDQLVMEMTELAYQDVIASGRYSYAAFGTFVANTLTSELRTRRAILVSASTSHAAPLAHAVKRRTMTTAPVRAVIQRASAVAPLRSPLPAPVPTAEPGTTSRQAETVAPSIPDHLFAAPPRGAAHLVRRFLLPVWLVIPELVRSPLRPAVRTVLRVIDGLRA